MIKSNFYQQNKSLKFRFGDIISGLPFIEFIPKIKINPFLIEKESLSIDYSTKLVMLTPSCQIKHNSLTFAPLEQLDGQYLKLSSYIDIDAFNEENNFYELLQDSWDKIPESLRKNISTSNSWVFFDKLFYRENTLLSRYNVKSHLDIGSYMVSLTKLFSISCEEFKTDPDVSFIERIKLLELTVDARKQIYKKFLWYYKQIDNEDIEEILE